MPSRWLCPPLSELTPSQHSRPVKTGGRVVDSRRRRQAGRAVRASRQTHTSPRRTGSNEMADLAALIASIEAGDRPSALRLTTEAIEAELGVGVEGYLLPLAPRVRRPLAEQHRAPAARGVAADHPRPQGPITPPGPCGLLAGCATGNQLVRLS